MKLFVVLFGVTAASPPCDWRHHRREPNVVIFDLAQGAHVQSGIEAFCRQDILMNDVDGCVHAVSRALLGRHKYVSLDAVAPYRLQLRLTLPSGCHRLEIADNFDIVFDSRDDLPSLASSSCSHLRVDDCERRVTEALLSLNKTTTTECPLARARRLASYHGGHACAGPWENLDVVEPTTSSCVESFFGTKTCLFRYLYVRDGVWYAVDDDNEFPENVRLGTRSDSPFLQTRRISKKDLTQQSVLRITDSVIHVLMARWQPFGSGEGHGHTLHDVALPVFWASDDLQANYTNLQLVFLDGELRAPADEWLATLSRRPPIYTHEISSFLCPPHAWCALPYALAGIGGRSYFSHEKDDDDSFMLRWAKIHELFAKFARDTLGVRRRHPVEERAKNVLIIQRLHSRVLVNVDELADALRGAGTLDQQPWTVSVEVLDFLEPEAQINEIDRADLIVAVEGGALDLLLLSPSPIAVVVVGRNPALPWPEGCSGCDSKTQFTHGRMLDYALSWISSVQVTCCSQKNESGATCGDSSAQYAPNPDEIVDAARSALSAASRR